MGKKFLSLIKESLGGIIIALLLSFMLAFYEPFNMYTSNVWGFWFDIYDFFPIVVAQFLGFFFILSVVFIIANIISKHVYRIMLVVAFIVTIATYIQGNYFASNLPSLDGSPVDWGVYGKEKIISIILWLVVIIVSLTVLYFVKFKKFDKIIKFVSVVILLMLMVTSVTLFMKPQVFDDKSTNVTSFDNFDSASRDKNFFIFITDQVDSAVFDQELSKNWNKEDIFEDFTYYPNTTSTYLWTMFSVPYILSGDYFENEEAVFGEYFTKAIDNSMLLNELENRGYQLNMFEDEEILNYQGNNIKRFANVKSNVHVKKRELIKQEIKYVLFKYLPYQLKKIAKIENLNFNRAKESNGEGIFSSRNDKIYNHLNNAELRVENNKYFSYTRIMGAHPPFVFQSEIEYPGPEGTYEDGINSSIAVVKAFIDRLRKNGVYDNSVIIIMADHGHGEKTIDRSNPILYIKGFNEKHNYRKSDKKISYENLNDAYKQLMNGDTTDKLFQNLDNSKRRILYNELYIHEFKEMIQTGDAWDSSTIVETGREYLKKK